MIDSGFLRVVEKTALVITGKIIGVLADKGFLGFDAFQVVGGRLITPSRVTKGRHDFNEAIASRRIASIRIFVEIAIRAVKTHALLHRLTNGSQRVMLENCVIVSALLTNFKKPFRHQTDENIENEIDPSVYCFEEMREKEIEEVEKIIKKMKK